ncbi:unnamed protein product [Toxocara canis]|uniref:WW domain-binding protein 4 n=1 Tax=Toxocara canis TaxID=6265 RepID=A0A183VC86_TOXCA|nr:unnamed protein product [Toxocara canis]
MTDVWKSNARKFCEICKVWFADNKVSIEHHEGGRKHKEAIQAKLRELGKQSKQKEKAQASLQATLAAMESAAKKSMTSSSNDATTSANLPCAPIGPSPKPRTYMDPRAHSSSVAAMAQEMARRKKEREEAKKLATKSQHWRDDDGETAEVRNVKEESQEEIVWAETITNDGMPYYFHIYSGETLWTAPGRYYTAAQYAAKLADIGRSQEAAVGLSGNLQRPQALQPDTKLNRAARRAGLADTHEMSENTANVAMDVADIPTPGSFVPCATSDYHKAPFVDGAAIAAAFRLEDHNIPLPPPPQVTMPLSPPPQESKCETQIEAEAIQEDDVKEGNQIKEEPKDADEVIAEDHQIATATSESSQEIESKEGIKEAPTDEERPKSPPRISRPSPYGEWRKVEERVEEPKIDYELPTEEQGRKAKKEETIVPEDIVEFGEKSAPVSRKRPKLGSIEFKKRKVSMSARRRGDGD